MNLEGLKQLKSLQRSVTPFELERGVSIDLREISTTQYLKSLDLSQSDPTLSDAMAVAAACPELEDDLEFIQSWPREVLKKATAKVLDISGLKLSRTASSVLDSMQEHVEVLVDLVGDDQPDLKARIEGISADIEKALDLADGLEAEAEKK